MTSDMKAPGLYSHKRSFRREAYGHLATAVGFPVAMWVMIETFAEGKISVPEMAWVYAGSAAVSLFLVVVFVFPNIRKSGGVEFLVTRNRVVYRESGAAGYEVPTHDIERIVQVKSPRGGTYFEEWMYTKDGNHYRERKRDRFIFPAKAPATVPI